MTNNILTVSKLNQIARNLIETNFSNIWVEGEISNLTMHGSGHWYFLLKDECSQIKCAMFKTRNRSLKFKPEN